jgi:hypothetical protein
MAIAMPRKEKDLFSKQCATSHGAGRRPVGRLNDFSFMDFKNTESIQTGSTYDRQIIHILSLLF